MTHDQVVKLSLVLVLRAIVEDFKQCKKFTMRDVLIAYPVMQLDFINVTFDMAVDRLNDLPGATGSMAFCFMFDELEKHVKGSKAFNLAMRYAQDKTTWEADPKGYYTEIVDRYENPGDSDGMSCTDFVGIIIDSISREVKPNQSAA